MNKMIDFPVAPGRDQSVDEELYSKQFQVENKMFYVDLKANTNGMYLKISEKSGGRRHNVFLPAPGLHELKEAIEEALKRI
jgi:hypothetical protein